MSSKADLPEKNQEAGTHHIAVTGVEEELPRFPRFKCHTSLSSLLKGAIFCCCFLPVCILAIPLLVVPYLVVRLLQFLTNGDTYFKATHVRNLIRLLMTECMLIVMILLVIFYLLSSTVSKIHHITLYDLSIGHWIQATCIIIVLYALSYCLSYVVQIRSPPMLWQYERGVNAAQAATEIIDCLILWCGKTLILNCSVPPSFNQHHVLGLPTHKFIQVAIFTVIGIDTIAFSCHFITYLLQKCYKKTKDTHKMKPWKHIVMEALLFRKYAVYWADGLGKNIVFIFSSMLLFRTWNSSFRTHLTATPEDKKMVRFVTMAFASLFTLALLWLIKSCILLLWKANQVYAHLRPRLLENREELYFLGILGSHKFDIFSIRGCSALTKQPLGSTGSTENKLHWHLSQLVGFVWHPKLIDQVRNDLSMWDDQEDVEVGGSEIWRETLHDLQKMAQYFLRAQPTLSSDKYVSDMLDYLTTSVAKWNLEEYLEKLINDKGDLKGEWCWFKKLVTKQYRRSSSKEIKKSSKSTVDISEPGTSSSKQINESRTSNQTQEPLKIDKEKLKAWLENARGTCMELANTVSSAEEVVNCLDNIISGLLIGAAFIMWLLLTGLATTKILVIIASPLLAVTFVFGDTCKSLFQGIIFVYVRHPLNVGDLVIIDDKMMEVKILGIWQTIFVEIVKTDEVIYPNSELANKKIINYKSDFDWNDCLEFSLKSFGSDKIETLRKAIKENLSKDEKCSPNYISTELLATKEDVKVIVHLKYNPENHLGMTLYERLQEKEDYRSLFTIKIWNLLKQHKTQKD